MPLQWLGYYVDQKIININSVLESRIKVKFDGIM